jgi:hypothetical protein
LLQKLAPESLREERRTGVLSEENKNARTPRATAAFAFHSDATVGIDRSASVSLPKHLACESTPQFFTALCSLPTHREKFRTDRAIGIPTFVIGIFEGEGRSMLLRDTQAMLWFVDRWWWFPTASTVFLTPERIAKVRL